MARVRAEIEAMGLTAPQLALVAAYRAGEGGDGLAPTLPNAALAMKLGYAGMV